MLKNKMAIILWKTTRAAADPGGSGESGAECGAVGPAGAADANPNEMSAYARTGGGEWESNPPGSDSPPQRF